MKKKILLFILVITLIISNASHAFAIHDDDPDGMKCFISICEYSKKDCLKNTRY